MPRPDRWSREQLIAVYNLYCQLPFGKMDARNRDVIALASAIGRSPNAVALKLVNFASLDPAIRASGRRGMGNVSVADRAIWEEFHGNWNKLVAESQQVLEQIGALKTEEAEISKHTGPLFEEGRTREATIQMRLRQSFFRRSVLSSYRGRCCMSGITDERLLTASHIVPWSLDTTNRLNPRNGHSGPLCQDSGMSLSYAWDAVRPRFAGKRRRRYPRNDQLAVKPGLHRPYRPHAPQIADLRDCRHCARALGFDTPTLGAIRSASAISSFAITA